MDAPCDTLTRVADLYREGRYVDALGAGECLGPLQAWPGAHGRVMAGRLATMLGAPRWGRVLHGLAWRRWPADPEAAYFCAMGLLARRGPWPAWQFLERYGDLPEARDPHRADWFALRAQVLGMLRDFESAEEWLDRAERLAPERPWIWVERAALLDAEDRREEALDAARRALELRPWFRPAVQTAAHYLVQLNRDDEALALLTGAAERLQCGDLFIQLAALKMELRCYTEARADLQRALPLLPLLERDRTRRKLMAAQRADAAYYCGDYDEAARLAAEADLPFFKEIAKRLAVRPLEGKRVLLPVGFVRQHYVTCAPATLAMLSQYWSKPADHLEVAEKICYDGTPAHSERRWAEDAGFLVREFRIAWGPATALLDRGVPFALHTVDPGSAHLQAVIGYDARRGTFLVRDPSERHFGEVLAEKLLEHYRSTGPRGVALVPRERAELLEGLELPDAGLYDDCYQIELALQAHDRQRAQEIHNRLRQSHPTHPLTLRARGAMAGYDADTTNILHYAELLLKQFPDDPNLQVTRLNCLRELGRREDRLAALEKLCAKPDADPFFLVKYAQELADDARERPRVLDLLGRALRRKPLDADNFALRADVAWDRGQRGEALALYRFAACLADKDQARARSYFIAARHLRQTDRALGLLADRFRRFGARSGHPAQTLCWAYEQLERTGAAFDALDQALSLRPDDGDLLLSAADAHGRYGRSGRAGELLRRAEGISHRLAWLRTAAWLALYRSDLAEALDHAREVAEAEPLARDAVDLVAQLTADLEGEAAAVGCLRQAVARFPHSYSLRVLLIEWLRRDDPGAVETAVRELLELQPVDPWAHRELAIALIEQGKWDEAAVEGELAMQLEPSSPVAHLVRGRVLQAAGRAGEARESFRRAVRLSIDYDPAISALMSACDSKAERVAELGFLAEELSRQVIFGDGLLAFRDYASATLEPEVLLKTLREALSVRPDLWHAYAALVRQLVELGRAHEALEVARSAVERFPLLPRTWVELAGACRAAKDPDSEIEALKKAMEIAPNWGEAVRQLSEALRRQGEGEQAAAVLRQAVAREPRDARNHGFLAEALWDLGRRREAVERLVQAVRMEPGYDWAWGTLREWSAEMDEPEMALEMARQLTRLRPNQARSWIVLARLLQGDGQLDERLEALDRAAALNPQLAEVHSMRADCLAALARYDEALAACRPAAFNHAPPLELCARAADVEYRRGNVQGAVAAMREVLARDPDYLWAWSRLAEWYDGGGQTAEYLEAAGNMVRVAPQMPVGWGLRGDARLRAGQRDEARADFARALEIAPDYTFAAMSLFDLHLEDGDPDAAERVLQSTLPHLRPEHALVQQVRLAAKRQDRDKAVECLDQLCGLELEDDGPLGAACDAMLENPWRAQVADLLDQVLRRPGASPHVGPAWAQCLTAAGQWDRCERVLRDMEGQSEIWFLAAARFMTRLGDAARREQLLRFLRRHKKRIGAHPAAWGAAGQALCDLDLDRKAVRWLSDWTERQGVTPRMVFSLVLSLWKLRRRSQAVEAGRRALQLAPDHAVPYHRLWLAADAVLSGRADAAREYTEGTVPDRLSPFYQTLYRLIEAAADPATFAEAAGRMRQIMRDAPREIRRDRLLRRVYHLFRSCVARRHGRRVRAWLAQVWAVLST